VATELPVPLIFNPIAGRGRAAGRAASVSALLASSGVANTALPSKTRGDIETLVKRAIADGHRRLIVAGGDGSVHEAVNGIMTTDRTVELGVISIGSGNDFAKACSIPLHWEHAAALLADRMSSGAPAINIDIGRCNQRYFANSAGIGFDARVSAVAERIRLPIGDLVYLVGLGKALLQGVATPEMRVRFGTQEFTGAATVVNFANGPWVGGLFNIAPAAHNDDGQLDLIYAGALRAARVLTLVPKIIKGTHLEDEEVHRFPVKSATVETPAPVLWHLDGEVQTAAARFDIDLQPGALRLL